MEGFVPADLRAESENEQVKEEGFIEIILKLRQKRISEVELEILPSAPFSAQLSTENGEVFLGVTKAAVRRLLLVHSKTHPWLEAVFLPQSERFWRSLRKSDDSDISWQLLVTRLALEVLPKALEPFAHRRFLLRKHRSQLETESVIESEWNLVYRCSQLHRANYHAWEHARWLHNLCPALFDFCLFAKTFQRNVTDCSIGSFAIFLLQVSDHVDALLDLAKSLIPIYPDNQNLRRIIQFDPDCCSS